VAEAIGMIEVEGVAGIIVGADAALKAAEVSVTGWESIGGFTTLFIAGPVGDVETAMGAGAQAAKDVVDHVVTAALHQPQREIAEFIGFPLTTGNDQAHEQPLALGLVETRGYGSHVATNDAMVKAADVRIANVLTVHNRVVCTLVTGSIDDVEQAIDTARQLLSGSEWFLAATVISQPMPDVLRAFVHTRAGAGAS
jgi:ethanolamine utilization protein EutM